MNIDEPVPADVMDRHPHGRRRARVEQRKELS